MEKVCYDIFRNWNDEFLWDVKILYELKGYKFEDIVDLSNIALGNQSTQYIIEIFNKLKAHINSYKVSKINILNYTEKQLFPKELSDKYYKEKHNIILQLLRKHQEEKQEEVDSFYKSFYDKIKVVHNISSIPIDIDLESIKEETDHNVKTIQKNTVNGKSSLKFHIVGAKTGRLAFEKGSINVYGLPRHLRKCIVAPQGYDIVEFDLKAAQPRLAIFDTQNEEFKDKFRDVVDIYSIFPGDREKNKIDFLTWMYYTNRNETFEKEAYSIVEHKNNLYHTAKQNGKVVNRFGRVLFYHEGEEKHVLFQNYITSLEVDSILQILCNVYDRLKNTQSRILFPFHDSIVCCVNKKENCIIEEIRSIIQDTLRKEFNALFPVNIKTGKNYGDMK